MPSINNSVNSSMNTSKLGHYTDGKTKEYFWGCEFNSEKKSVTWTFEEEEEDGDYLQHTLFLRQAVLGKGVAKDQRHIVEVTTKNYDGEEVTQPIFSLTLGQQDMVCVDLSFSHEHKVTFSLVEGEGPVFLSAVHLVEFPFEDEDVEEEYESDHNDTEIEDLRVQKLTTKRKAGIQGGKKKRGKLDKDDDEDDESMDEDEDEVDEDEEDADEEEDEEEEEESDESPAKPIKKKGAAKGKKGKANGTPGKKGGKSPVAKNAKKGKKVKA